VPSVGRTISLMDTVSQIPGTPRTRTSDTLGRVPRSGEVMAYVRRTGLSKVSVRIGLRAGRLRVGDDGLIYPRPSAGGSNG